MATERWDWNRVYEAAHEERQRAKELLEAGKIDERAAMRMTMEGLERLVKKAGWTHEELFTALLDHNLK